MFKTILVPLDGSALGAQAVAPAFELAGPDTELLLLQSIEGERAPATIGAYAIAGTSWLDEPDKPFRAAADHLVQVRASLPVDLSVEMKITHGGPAEAIVAAARRAAVDLIVMASHGYKGLRRWMLGSVTEKVLQNAPCPVLVVRGTPRFKHMLVTLDGSALSEQAIRPALATAAAFHSGVTLLRVIPLPAAAEMNELDRLEAGMGQHLFDGQIAEMQAYLGRAAAEHGVTQATFKVVVPAADAAEAIALYARAHSLDLVVMATHGRSGLRRWAFGSVTDQVLHSVDCSLLVVPPRTAEQN